MLLWTCTTDHLAKLSLLLLNVASLSWEICTYAYQGHVWICSATLLLCTYLSAVWECVNSWPRAKMYVFFTAVWQLHVCASSCMSAFVLYSLWILLNLAWGRVRASLLLYVCSCRACYPVSFPPCPLLTLVSLWSCVAAHSLCIHSSEEENSFVAAFLHISLFF